MYASVVPQSTKELQRRRSICVQTLTLDLRTGKVTAPGPWQQNYGKQFLMFCAGSHNCFLSYALDNFTYNRKKNGLPS